MKTFTLHLADLAGHSHRHPIQIHTCIQTLINHYLAEPILHAHLQDLPHQFLTPRPRPWAPICWSRLSSHQILSLDPEVFLQVIRGAIETEMPIRGYTQTSRCYLEPIHPHLAHYVGGQISPAGTMLELGLWEREERRHGPALIQIYTRIAGQKPSLSPHKPREFDPSNDSYRDLYRHGVHRITTEFGAVCLYLWLMAHTTADLQQVLGELLQDEINHLCKFWGSGLWLYPSSMLQRLRFLRAEFGSRRRDRSGNRSNLWNTYLRMTRVLAWRSWSWDHRLEFLLTLTLVLHRLLHWSRDLDPDYLHRLFGPRPQTIAPIA